MRITHEQLEHFATTLLREAGASDREASITAGHLVESNLAGHDSHGAMRVLQYVQDIEAGRIVPGQRMELLDEWKAGLVVDASGAFGQVACHDAMQRAIEKARDVSIAAVTVRHCNHSGRLGTYVEMAANANMIGIVMANGGGAGQWVAPFGGCDRRLSTNPIAIGSPSGGDFPFVLDISTSIAPEGKVRDYLQREQEVPDGWLVNHRGEPTNDPSELYAELSGALLPFGGQAGHKGFGLGFMVDVFSGALSAAGCPRPDADDSATGTGLFMLAIDTKRFSPLQDFLDRVGGMGDYIKSSRPATGFDEVLVPGEFEHRRRQQRRDSGIDIPDTVWTSLCELADTLGTTAPELPQETA